MFKTYMKNIELDIRTNINSILYYFRKIPLLGRLASKDTYKLYGLKNFLSKIGIIPKFFMQIFDSGLSYLILMLISYGILSIFDMEGHYSVIPLIFSLYVFTSFFSFNFFSESESNFRLFSLFNMDPKDLAISSIFINGLILMISRTVIVSYVFLLDGHGMESVIYIFLYQYLLAIIGNGIHTYLYDKGILTEKVLGIYLLVTNFFLPIILTILIIYFNLDLFILLRIEILIGLFILAGLSSYYLLKYNGYTKMLLSFDVLGENYSGIEINRNQKEEEVKLSEEDRSITHVENLHGYDLLNEIFFERHKKYIIKPIIIKTGIMGIILLAILIAPHVSIIQQYLGEIDMDELLMALTGFLPFNMFIIFNNELLVKTMFINCDQSLMEYGFYTRAEDLLEMFTLRLKKTLKLNFLACIVFFIGLILAKVFYDVDTKLALIVGVEVISLWIFYSVHTLFIYYIFQPYNKDLETKNPIYHIIDGVVYAISFIIMNEGLRGLNLAIILIIATVIYSILALFLVYKFSPKTFKVRV